MHKLTEAEKAQQRALVLAHDRYRSGLVDFLDVLEAERSLYTGQAHLAQGERAVSQNLVRLYKALGGGWEKDLAREKARGQVSTYTPPDRIELRHDSAPHDPDQERRVAKYLAPK